MNKDASYSEQTKFMAEYLNMVIKFRNSSRLNLKYHSFEEFVERCGDFMEYRPFDKEKYPKAFRTSRQCYKNAYHLASAYENLTYCEGYALAFGIPVFHAWCVDENDFVVDPTKSHEGVSTVYYGVMFKYEYVFDVITEKGYYGVIDNPEHKFPLLTGEHENKYWLYEKDRKRSS